MERGKGIAERKRSNRRIEFGNSPKGPGEEGSKKAQDSRRETRQVAAFGCSGSDCSGSICEYSQIALKSATK